MVKKIAIIRYRTFRSTTVNSRNFWKDGNGQWLKWFCEAGGGAHLTKPGWSKPHTHSNPTNLALFRHKITLYTFNQGAHTIAGGLKWELGGLSPASPPHFNHWEWHEKVVQEEFQRLKP